MLVAREMVIPENHVASPILLSRCIGVVEELQVMSSVYLVMADRISSWFGRDVGNATTAA